MAVAVKKYLDEGASLTRGYGDRRRTQRIVPCYVSGLTDDSGAADAAVDAAKTAVGASITDDSVTVPLADAACNILGPSIDGTLSAIVYLKYGFTDSDPPLYDTFSFVKEESFSERAILTYKILDTDTGTSTDAPVGTAFILADNEALYGLSANSPVHEILAPFVSTTNVVNTVSSLYGHLNLDAVVIEGVTRAAKTLKFRGVRQETVDKRGGKVYRGFYVYDYVPAGYAKYYLSTKTIPDPNADPGDLTPDTVTQYFIESRTPGVTSSTFANAFPTSQGTGPAAA